MICRHCQQWNPEEQDRCRVCGGNLKTGNESGEWRINTVEGSLAAAPQRARAPRQQARAAAASVSTQRNLFVERPVSNVIPFESLPGGARTTVRLEQPPSPA